MMKRIMLAVAICILSISGTGCRTFHRFVTPSPDGEKEQYTAKPAYRKVIRTCVVPFEWTANIVALLFLSREAREGIGTLYLADESLYVLNKKTGKTKRYSPFVVGVWSPDSRWIACEGRKQNDERIPLCLIDTLRDRETAIPIPGTPRNWAIQDISWSEDSRRVFFRQEFTVYAYGLAENQLVSVAQGQTAPVVDTKKLGTDAMKTIEPAPGHVRQ